MKIYDKIRAQMLKYTVKSEKKTGALHWFISVSNHLRTFVANYQMSGNTRFLRNFFCLKIYVCGMSFTNIMCGNPEEEG